MATVEPRYITHKAEGVERLRQIDLIDVYAIAEGAKKEEKIELRAYIHPRQESDFMRYQNMFTD
jgi:hypothetical protein